MITCAESLSNSIQCVSWILSFGMLNRDVPPMEVRSVRYEGTFGTWASGQCPRRDRLGHLGISHEDIWDLGLWAMS